MNDTFVWSGRHDAEEIGDSTRWHQHVRPFDAHSRAGVALVGFAVDEGVRRNGGRVGAAAGPHAMRSALANMPVLGEPVLWDSGDVRCHEDALEAAQEALATRVAAVSAQGCRPLVLGGGHEMAWGTFQGIVRAHPSCDRLLVVNLDAHFDLRMAARANSSTPFRQMAEWCTVQHRPFDYRVFGISRFGNTHALFERAQALGGRHVLDEALQTSAVPDPVRESLARDLEQCTGVYLTICLDVLPAHVAPGVSAPASLGVPLHIVEQLVEQVMQSRKVLAADLAELNPTYDEAGRTARAAARLAARIARAWG